MSGLTMLSCVDGSSDVGVILTAMVQTEKATTLS